RASPRQAARAEADRRRQIVDRGELDELVVHAQLAEEDGAPRRAAAKRCEGALCAAVGLTVRLSVEGQPEAVDAEAALAERDGGERASERLLPCDEAAAEDGHERREREHRATDDERGA